MSSIIEVSNLYKSFKVGDMEVDVLKDINLKIEAGTFVSIMGPSGSGKSTLLYLIGGLDNPSKGTIRVNNNDVSKLKDQEMSIMRRRDIGFIFQFYNLVPNLSIKDNVLLPIFLDGKNIKEYTKKAYELLQKVGLEGKEDYLPKELSGGQQQRTAIARALINDPKIILADEPIGNLDSKTGIEIMNLLKEINIEKGITIIQVTHSNESSTYGDRVIRIKDGQVQ